MDAAPSDWSRTCLRHWHRGRTLPLDAARYGRRHCRLTNTISRLGSTAEPHYPCGVWSRPLCSRPGDTLHLFDMNSILTTEFSYPGQPHSGELDAYSRSFCTNPF